MPCGFKTSAGKCENLRGPGRWKAVYDDMEHLLEAVGAALDDVQVEAEIQILESDIKKARRLFLRELTCSYGEKCSDSGEVQCPSFDDLSLEWVAFCQSAGEAIKAVNDLTTSKRVGSYTDNERGTYLAIAKKEMGRLWKCIDGVKREINVRLIRSECMTGLQGKLAL